MSNLLKDNKEIMKFWNYDKNDNDILASLTVRNNKKVWWICPNGHEWNTSVYNLSNSKSCPICSNRKILKGYNDLATLFPKLAKEWDYSKNIEIDPSRVSINSIKSVWWICPKGHSYSARIDRRTIGNGCPYCSNHRVLSGFNDLATKKPEVIKEWDYKKNNGDPRKTYMGSTKKAHFICKNGHNYQMIIRDYVKGYNCPVCANRVIQEGYNDFASFDERLLKEWDYKKNKIKPNEISSKSNTKVWWIGECGHEWEATINSRTMAKTNCPICAEERHASISEKSVLFYIKKSNKYSEVLENYKDDIIKLELDIYIPSIKTAIEYDGERWHKNIKKDLKKDLMCKKNKIKLIRIREYGCSDYNSSSIKIFLPNNKTKGLEKGIDKVLELLKIDNVNVNIEKDTTEILKMINFMVKENSILNTHPEIAKEWHPTKNGNLKPEHTKPGSNKKVWWICPNGHEYQLSVNSRTNRGNGCPYCSNHRVLKGYNDLKTLYPKIADSWNYKKNKTLLPSEVLSGSKKKVWWVCPNGHEWEATISYRTVRGQNCPYCSGKKVLKGYNSLFDLNPELAKEWDYKKNTICPDNVSLHSGKKVWWVCPKCNHEWEATIDKRTNGSGCPNCRTSNFKSKNKW